MKMERIKQWVLLLAGVLPCLCLLPACGGKALEPPETYQIGEDSAPALPLSGGGELKSVSEPSQETDPITYTYQELPSAWETAESYAELLTGEEQGFVPVDEDGARTELPEDVAETGELHLAKTAAAAGHLFEITLSWADGECTVTVAQPEGTLAEETAEPMTAEDALEYIRGFTPNELGLTGTDMGEYQIYPRMGVILVDGVSCLELDVYRTGRGGTNSPEGVLLLSGDKKHLYRLDKAGGTVTELHPGHT